MRIERTGKVKPLTPRVVKFIEEALSGISLDEPSTANDMRPDYACLGGRLGNLLPRIRGLYRKGDIDAATVRHLTLASKARQRDWLGLLDDPDAHCPVGHQLKAWLFGGASVPVSAALFDVADYAGESSLAFSASGDIVDCAQIDWISGA